MWLLLSTLPCPADNSFWVTGSQFWSTSPCSRIIQPLCPVFFKSCHSLVPIQAFWPLPWFSALGICIFYYHLPPLPNSLHFFCRWWCGGLVAKSCPALATPWTVACQVLLSMGFSWQEYWSELPFPSSGNLLDPGTEPGSSALQADSLLAELWAKPSFVGNYCYS